MSFDRNCLSVSFDTVGLLMGIPETDPMRYCIVRQLIRVSLKGMYVHLVFSGPLGAKFDAFCLVVSILLPNTIPKHAATMPSLPLRIQQKGFCSSIMLTVNRVIFSRRLIFLTKCDKRLGWVC